MMRLAKPPPAFPACVDVRRQIPRPRKFGQASTQDKPTTFLCSAGAEHPLLGLLLDTEKFNVLVRIGIQLDGRSVERVQSLAVILVQKLITQCLRN